MILRAVPAFGYGGVWRADWFNRTIDGIQSLVLATEEEDHIDAAAAIARALTALPTPETIAEDRLLRLLLTPVGLSLIAQGHSGRVDCRSPITILGDSEIGIYGEAAAVVTNVGSRLCDGLPKTRTEP